MPCGVFEFGWVVMLQVLDSDAFRVVIPRLVCDRSDATHAGPCRHTRRDDDIPRPEGLLLFGHL